MHKWITTYTGKQFFPLQPKIEDIDSMDIAHALSMKCRFGGHCSSFYSVADHSVRVAHLCRQNLGWGLMHDAAEAYLPDVVSPIKASLVGFQDLEDNILQLIAKKYGLCWPIPDEVHRADKILLSTELRDLMLGNRLKDIEPLQARIFPVTVGLAKHNFIYAFRKFFPNYCKSI